MSKRLYHIPSWEYTNLDLEDFKECYVKGMTVYYTHAGCSVLEELRDDELEETLRD